MPFCWVVALTTKTRKQKKLKSTPENKDYPLVLSSTFIFLNIFLHVKGFPLKIIHKTWNLIKYWCNFWGHLSFCKIYSEYKWNSSPLGSLLLRSKWCMHLSVWSNPFFDAFPLPRKTTSWTDFIHMPIYASLPSNLFVFNDNWNYFTKFSLQ